VEGGALAPVTFEQLAAIARPLLAGEAIVAWACGEPGNRAEPEQFQTRAELSATKVVLNAVETYVEEGADAAAFLGPPARPRGRPRSWRRPVTPIAADAGAQRRSCAASPKCGSPMSSAGERAAGDPSGADAAVERQLQQALLLQSAETDGVLERALAADRLLRPSSTGSRIS